MHFNGLSSSVANKWIFQSHRISALMAIYTADWDLKRLRVWKNSLKAANKIRFAYQLSQSCRLNLTEITTC